ncbi:MAG: glycosyltransferase family 4 protein [Synergistaceae bacterium]|jgi:glycosyltransferase involved in cell wall biosynthesis|nr:glycosyltransferase family 4 protein [Synergistaceae bacterium]
MKILHYVDSADVTFCVPWIDLMKELGRTGVDQALLCRPGGNMASAALANGVDAVAWKPFVSNLPVVNFGYPRIVSRLAPDIVHTRGSNAAGIAGFWGRFLKIPVVAILDGTHYKKKYYTGADYFTACSEAAKNSMASKGLDPRKIEVTYNSIDISKYRPDGAVREDFRRRLGLGAGDRAFVSAGAFRPIKGFDVFIKAFAALRERGPNVKLLLAGDGECKDSYLRLAGELGVSDSVVISDGFVPDIRPWLWAADCFVLPSIGEPFGIIVLEAMAAGLPVIVTDSGGPGEIIHDGAEGLVVPPRSPERLSLAMEAVLAMSGNAISSMKENMKKRLEVFTVQKHAFHLVKIYEKVLAEYRSR